MEDIKTYHKDTDEARKMISYIELIYEPVTVNQEKKHTHLGMDQYFTYKITLKISTTGYIDKAMDELPKTSPHKL